MKGIKIEPVTISTYKQSDPLASMYFHPASPLPWSWIANSDAYPQINRHGNHTSDDFATFEECLSDVLSTLGFERSDLV